MRLGSNCGTAEHSGVQPTSALQSQMADVGWQARIAAKAGWIASCHEIDVEWVQVAAKRDGIAASVHLRTLAGRREDLEWAKLLSATVSYQGIPRRLNIGQAFPASTEALVALGPSPSWTSAWGECEREIVRRKVDGEVRSLGMHARHVHEHGSQCVSTARYTNPGELEQDDEQVRSS